ncbi:MAG TPA: NUDIX hydrolase [Candidatus Paceibacterota bacterium]|nr:NUDIX hydrolase [Candidatus Paceibacterota bacterium]
MDPIPEFGIKRENEERRDGGCAVVLDPASGLYAVGERTDDGMLILFSGGVDEGEDMHEGILREVREESGLHDFGTTEKIAEALTHYYNRAKGVNRCAQATCLLIVLNSTASVAPTLEAHERFSLVWRTPEEILENWKLHNHDQGLDHWMYFLTRGVARARELGVAP